MPGRCLQLARIGSGTDEADFLASNFAVQGVGEIDIRKPTSIHGLRLTGDYRRVFAGDRGRHQFQFLVAYFLGWRGLRAASPSRR